MTNTTVIQVTPKYRNLAGINYAFEQALEGADRAQTIWSRVENHRRYCAPVGLASSGVDVLPK